MNKSNNHILKINVGFLLKESAGYTRDIDFDESRPVIAGDVTLNQLSGKLRLTRTPQGIVVLGHLETGILCECTRCLQPFNLSFIVEFSDLFIHPRPVGSNEPYVILETGFIDLTPIMREEGILAVPIRALCKPDCMGLCSQCGQNLNETPCNCIRDEGDVRLAVLRALIDPPLNSTGY